MKKIFTIFLLALASCIAVEATVPYKFNVPDIPGYVTLTGDFHVHTCFSDATVWPTTRVVEAYYDGLDILAITDHCDSRQKKMVKKGYFNADKVDQNTSYKFARKDGKKYGVMVTHGAELSRGQRVFPGHFNVHFISDGVAVAEAAEKEDSGIKDVVKREETAIINGLREARRQGAFITFNHPNWASQQPVSTEWLPIHEKVFKEGMMDGIEIVNHSVGICPEGFHWAIEKNLTVVSGTDCHRDMCELVDYRKGEQRSRTLIFAKEKTEESVKEALLARRTVVYYDDCFYGAEANIRPFFNEALKVISTKVNEGKILVRVKNMTSAPIYLHKAEGSENISTAFRVKISPDEELTLSVHPLNGAKSFGVAECNLNYEVTNYFTDVDTPLKVSWHFDIPVKK